MHQHENESWKAPLSAKYQSLTSSGEEKVLNEVFGKGGKKKEPSRPTNCPKQHMLWRRDEGHRGGGLLGGLQHNVGSERVLREKKWRRKVLRMPL